MLHLGTSDPSGILDGPADLGRQDRLMKKALISVGLLVIAGTAVAAVSITGGEGGGPAFRTAEISGAISPNLFPPLVN